jgi:oligopeptide/dipeptide ABC transporter ATP-binding protein
MVMKGGRIVEQRSVDDLFRDPQHPYTKDLLEAIPRIEFASQAELGAKRLSKVPAGRPV